MDGRGDALFRCAFKREPSPAQPENLLTLADQACEDSRRIRAELRKNIELSFNFPRDLLCHEAICCERLEVADRALRSALTTTPDTSNYWAALLAWTNFSAHALAST